MDSQGVMPPFQGDERDRAALTAYLLSVHGAQVEPAAVLAEAQAATAVPNPAPPAPASAQPSTEVKP
jgi:hypothetical protein